MSSTQKTVVVIEDEPEAAELFSEMMRVSGFRVVKLSSSTPAMETILTEKPDVVLLDVMMPDISGLEVLSYMRREPSLKNIPVVVISAKGMPADIRTAMDAGATLYLTKPVGFLELKQAVDNALQGSA